MTRKARDVDLAVKLNGMGVVAAFMFVGAMQLGAI
jgi:hypothetical protein